MDDETQPEPAAVVGTVKRYPVTGAAGDVRHQLIMVTGVDDDGALRGFPLGYEHEAARFRPDDLAD